MKDPLTPELAAWLLKLECGFLSIRGDLEYLTERHRLCPIVVRCGCCRFMCPAQDVETLKGYVMRGGGHVRDISIHPEELRRAREVLAKQTRQAPPATYDPGFDESACGGAFDGSRVISDADPGL